MNINYHNTTDISDYSGAITEPVTLQEMKDYLRMEGFVDNDESTSTELESFDFDDTLLEESIVMAREQIEQFCGISLVPKTFESHISNPCGMIEIPYGPISSITSLTDDTEDLNDLDYTISGKLGGFVNLKSPEYSNMILTYEAGYNNTDCPAVPKSLKRDLMRLVAYFYENRGMEKEDGFIHRLCSKHTRNTWLA